MIDALRPYGGKLIEIPYTKGVSSTSLLAQTCKAGVYPEPRTQSLKRLLNAKNLSSFIEAHNPISALIGENEKVLLENESREFDGFWSTH